MSNQPIDHGWAWMCTLGAAVCMFFFIGILRSLGILLVDVIVRFDSTSAMASLILGFMGAGVSLTAPIGNAMGARYDSYRTVIMCGAVLMVSSTIISSFATNIFVIVFVFGVLSGVGMGVISGPAIITVGMYFSKRRSFANGLATAGGSCGQLVIPMLFRFLLDQFGFQGGMMIFGAICLHIIPAALLLRPLSFYNKPQMKTSARKPLMAGKADDVENGHETVGNGVNRNAVLDDEGDELIKPIDNGVNGRIKETNGHVKTEENGLNGINEVDDLNGDVMKRNGHTSQAVSHDDNGHVSGPESDTEHHSSSNYWKDRQRKYSTVSSAGSHTHRRKISVYSSQMSLAIQPPAGQLPETPKHAPWSQVCGKTLCCCCDYPEEVVPLVTWSLFKDKIFGLYLFGVCMGNSGYLNALLFLPPYAEELRIAKTTTAIMMSAMGVADLCSRIFGGWFGDQGYVERHRQLAISLLITGVSTMSLSFLPYFSALVAMLSFLGLLGGFYLSLMAVVLIDLMGLKRLSAGFGVTIMMQGVVNMFLPTALGFIRDVTGSYAIPFFLCGAMMLMGGISFILLPLLVKYEDNKKLKKTAMTSEKEHIENIETNI